jgi:hypothetical protein
MQCWFCGVEKTEAGYQAYLALYEMDGELEIERRKIGAPLSLFVAAAKKAVEALRSANAV